MHARAASAPARPRSDDPTRAAAERQAADELEAWRARAVPDASAPLGGEDLVRLLRDCVAALRLDPAIAEGFTVQTVHYYRRKDIIDPPDGRTVAARYDIRHLWQIAGARLAGYLGLVTLAEARDAMRGADRSTLLDFLAARVVDARARDTLRGSVGAPAKVAEAARPLPGRAPRVAAQPTAAHPGDAIAASLIPLTGDAWCVVPDSHPAHRSPAAARDLVRALAAALRVTVSS